MKKFYKVVFAGSHKNGADRVRMATGTVLRVTPKRIYVDEPTIARWRGYLHPREVGTWAFETKAEAIEAFRAEWKEKAQVAGDALASLAVLEFNENAAKKGAPAA